MAESADIIITSEVEPSRDDLNGKGKVINNDVADVTIFINNGSRSPDGDGVPSTINEGGVKESHTPPAEKDTTNQKTDVHILNGIDPDEEGRVDEEEAPVIEVEVLCSEEQPLGESAESEEITLQLVQSYKSGEVVSMYLPGLPVVTEVSSNLSSNRSRGPQFMISLEHGSFTWKVYKYYSDFLLLRRVLAPLRVRIRVGRRGRGRKRGYLPHLLTIVDINPLQITRTQNQLKKVRKFLNAILNDREFRSHRSTLKFLEISRLSFVESLGSKRKEGVITKRSGGHSRVTNCFGCGAWCVCRCSVWRQRWLILKDNSLAYIRSDRRTIAGVLLFDEGMTVSAGSLQTGLLYGLEIKTQSRTLLLKCLSRQSMKEWRESLLSTMASTGQEWVVSKRFNSFAPPRENCTIQCMTWFFNGDNSFPPEVTLVRSYLVLRDSITESAQGRYECLVENGGLSASAVITVYVNGSIPGL